MSQRKWGPGMLVTAAFIGPGTVLMASKSGAGYGFGLRWVVLFSVLAAIVFQEMAARLGIVTGEDLSVALRKSTGTVWLSLLITGLVLSAVLIGNAAYQAGNIAGATTGLQTLTGVTREVWAILIALIAGTVLWIGRLELLQKVLIALVAFMSILFLLSAILVKPDLAAVAKGIFVPGFDPDAVMVVIGLLGTTVVPYNLFLHSRSAVDTWHEKNAKPEDVRRAIRQSRIDTALSIGLGGLITMSILITASAAFYENGISLNGLPDVATQLKPVLGSTSEFIFCLGLTAAGLTSAITAPLAAGFVAAGCFGWGRDLRDWRTRSVMMLVVAFGVGAILFTAKGSSPDEIILFAQVANGLILPVVAVFLMWIMNRAEKLQSFRNGSLANLLGVVVIIVVSLIAFRQYDSVKGKMMKMFASDQTEQTESVESDEAKTVPVKSE